MTDKKKFIVRYATRNKKGQEQHKSYIIKATDPDTAIMLGNRKLWARKSYVQDRDYVYKAELHPESMHVVDLQKQVQFLVANGKLDEEWGTLCYQLEQDELAELVMGETILNWMAS
jgi:hypothetical protein